MDDEGTRGRGPIEIVACQLLACGDPLAPVVDFGHRQARHFCKGLLAGGVKLLGERAYSFAILERRVWKREWVETRCFHVYGLLVVDADHSGVRQIP